MYNVMVGESRIGVKHRLWTPDSGLWTVDYELWIMNCGLWTVDNEQILSMVVLLYWLAYDK